jgi:uncharacterized protein (TIGR03083 family)
VPAVDADLAALYRGTRLRFSGLVEALTDDERAAPVPACPGWSVHDVVAHVTGAVDDAIAGRISGPPDEDHTAGQVEARRHVPTGDLLAGWAEQAPMFEEVVGRRGVWPAVIDLCTHEQDVRGAVGRPGARGADVVRAASSVLAAGIRSPVPLEVRLRDDPGDDRPPEVHHLGGAGPDLSAPLVLDIDRFELLRLRMGRRSLRQARSLAWRGDPTPVLDGLFVFGPATEDLHEPGVGGKSQA